MTKKSTTPICRNPSTGRFTPLPFTTLRPPEPKKEPAPAKPA